MRGYFSIGVEGISKGFNLGNLVRTAHAFGASSFFTIGASVVSWIFLYPICGFIWDSLDGIWIAGLVASLIALLVYPYFKRVAERDAAREGQQYRDIFPEIHGPSDRQAPRESARQRGLL